VLATPFRSGTGLGPLDVPSLYGAMEVGLRLDRLERAKCIHQTMSKISIRVRFGSISWSRGPAGVLRPGQVMCDPGERLLDPCNSVDAFL
jgi:hypothetical protein